MHRLRHTTVDRMADPHERSDRFELIAACKGGTLERLANQVLADDPQLAVRQEPHPQLVMQQAREPVERRPFNLGEVLVTPAEVELNGARGFAVVPGKNEHAAFSGAIVDAAVATGHDTAPEIVDTLAAVDADRRAKRQREWAETKHTAVDFRTMEGEQ